MGTILWRNGGLSTVISTDQGISHNPWVSKWFHEMWGRRAQRRVHRAYRPPWTFGGCEISYLETQELSHGGATKGLHAAQSGGGAIRTDGETLCDAHDGVQTVAICNALDEAARTGRPQRVVSG